MQTAIPVRSSLTVQIGETSIPVWTIQGVTGGKNILVTAGMDGDEYASIDAAFRLISILSAIPLYGSVTVIPIVNLPGFVAERSENPKDGLLPKNMYPGKPDGKQTERIIWQLRESFVRGVDFWFDLHGGALTEDLTPCILGYEMGKNMDTLVKQLLLSLDARTKTFFRRGTWSKVTNIAKDGIPYMIFESGCRGRRDEADIFRIVRWVMGSLLVLGVTSKREKRYTSRAQRNMTVFRSMQNVVSPLSGYYLPRALAGQIVKKGDLLGITKEITGRKECNVTATGNGIILWCAVGAAVQKYQTLATLAIQPEILE